MYISIPKVTLKSGPF